MLLEAEYATCEVRGLAIDQHFFNKGTRHRQVDLPASGKADLVHVRYWSPEGRYYVQVLTVCQGVIQAAHYRQAQRYASGLQTVLDELSAESGQTYAMVVTTILVGTAVQPSSIKRYLGSGHSCRTYCYRYDVTGLWFAEQEPIPTKATPGKAQPAPELSQTLVVTANGILDNQADSAPETDRDGAN